MSRNLTLPEGCPAQPSGLLSDPEIPRLYVYPLEADHELLELTCEVYVYQAGMAYFIAPRNFVADTQNKPAKKPLQPLNFQIANLNERKITMEDTSFLVGVPWFRPKEGVLEMMQMGRGLGDCGHRYRWRHDGQAGRFVLLEARGRECADSTTVFPPPEHWPLLYADPTTSKTAENFQWVSVGTLSQPMDDVGCALTHRKTVGNFPQIFKHGPAIGAWMNLDRQERRLEPTAQSLDGTRPDEFRWEAVTIRVDYGPGIRQEGGMRYPKATITLIQGGREAVIPAKGGCDC